ncbi:MAG TPA: F0F1 ATP synthase subunit A [Candidatus Saccharimonadales bacterium]|nr:F0F1 ATP synthase subunit A [Candidatus Saccharimonadales bacterium]
MNTFAALDIHVSIAAQEVFSIGSFSVTNAMLTGLFGLAITLIIMFYVARRVKNGKYNRFVGLFQWVFEGLLKQVDDIIPDRKLARKVAPLAITIFFFTLINYWLSVIPGLETISVNGVPLLRSLAADLNYTIGIALITMVTVQIYAVKHLGVFGNAGRYLRNPFKDPVGAFEGILELIGEVSRGSALALRLFGNAFAGEVLLIVIAVLTGLLSTAVLPFFMAFELFIGFIQSYVFFVLTLMFTSLAVAHHSEPSPDHSPAVATEKVKQTG